MKGQGTGQGPAQNQTNQTGQNQAQSQNQQTPSYAK